MTNDQHTFSPLHLGTKMNQMNSVSSVSVSSKKLPPPVSLKRELSCILPRTYSRSALYHGSVGAVGHRSLVASLVADIVAEMQIGASISAETAAVPCRGIGFLCVFVSHGVSAVPLGVLYLERRLDVDANV